MLSRGSHVAAQSFVNTSHLELLILWVGAMHNFEIPRSALVVAESEEARIRLVKACRLGGYTVEQRSFSSAIGALEGTTTHNLVLVDIPEGSTEELKCLARMRTVPGAVTLPIIVTCREPNAEATVSALEAGADDVAKRPGSFDELLARMRAVVRRRLPELARDEVSYGLLTIRPEEREVIALIGGVEQRAQVGPTEFRLLHFLVTYPEAIHSRALLRSRLWPATGHVISERTIDAHINRLRRALSEAGLQPSIATVLNRGYRMDLPVEAKP